MVCGSPSRAENDNLSDLHLAAYVGNFSRVSSLMKTNGGNVDVLDKGGFTPLHRAVQGGHNDVVNKLLQSGADPHRTTNDGLTVLHIASYYNQLEVLNGLLKGKTKALLAQKEAIHGMTPLHMATIRGAEEIVEILLKAGASPMEKDSHGKSSRSCAEFWGGMEARGMSIPLSQYRVCLRLLGGQVRA